MKMVVKPGAQVVGSVSVGGREYKIKNGVIENVPDHLCAELEHHGFIAEGVMIQQEAEKALRAQAETANTVESEKALAGVREKLAQQRASDAKVEGKASDGKAA